MNTVEDARRFLRPHESLASFLDRALVEPTRTGIGFIDRARASRRGALEPGEILEIVGAAGCGKTALVTEIASRAVLPSMSHGVAFDGSSATCVVIDCDGKFDALRLLRTTDEKIADGIARAGGGGGGGAREEVYEEAMSRFSLVRAHGVVDVLKTLVALDAAWSGEVDASGGGGFGGMDLGFGRVEGGGVKQGEGSKSRQRLVMIDNVAAFYWLDRASRKDHDAPYNIQRVFSAMARLLKRLATTHRAAIVVTKATLSSTSDYRPGGEYRDFLPLEWSSAVTQRILLSPSHERVEYGEYAGVATWDAPAKWRGGKFIVTEQGIRC